jgi:inner membrane protein
VQWISHEIVTGVFVYSLTGGNGLCATAALAGSLVPDVIEGDVPLDPKGLLKWTRSHRPSSHWFVPYSMAALIAFVWSFFADHATATMENTTLALTAGRNRGTLPVIAGFFLMGAVFHIGEDSLCGTVPSLNPRKRIGVRLFYVGSVQEHFITAALVVAFVIVWLKGVLW